MHPHIGRSRSLAEFYHEMALAHGYEPKDMPCSSFERFHQPYPEMDSRIYQSMSPVRETHNEIILHESDLYEMLNVPVTCSGEKDFNFMEKGSIMTPHIPQTAMNITTQPQPNTAVFQHQQANPQLSSLGSDNIWLYQDPQGKIQGPFDANHMKLWYKKGYFDEFLLVKRLCDPVMIPLGNFGSTPPFMQATNSPPALMWNQGFSGEANLTRNEDDLVFNQQQMGHVNQFPVSQHTLNELLFRNMVLENSARNDDFLMRQQQQRNVNTSASPMAGQIQMFDRPSQVLDIFQSPLLENSNMPAEQNPVTSYSQPPRDEGLILATDDEPRAPALWREFQQNLKIGRTTWAVDNKYPVEDLRHNLQERPAIPHTSTLPHTSSVPDSSVGQPFYNIWNNYEPVSPSSLFDKPDSHLKQPTEDVSHDIPMPSIFQQQLFVEQYRQKLYEEEMKRKTENTGHPFYFNKFDLVPPPMIEQNYPVAETAPQNDVTLLKKIDEYLEGFQKVVTKKEEKQIKLQKNKEAKKKAEESRKLEDQPANLSAFKAVDEYNRHRQKDIPKVVPKDLIHDIQKQRTAKVKSVPWSSVPTTSDETDMKLMPLLEIQKLEREKKIEQVREHEMELQRSAAKRQVVQPDQEVDTSPGWLKLATALPSTSQKTLTEIQSEEMHHVQAAAAKDPPRSCTPQKVMSWKQPSTGFWDSTAAIEAQRKLLAVFEKAASPVHSPAKKQDPPQVSNNSASNKATKAKAAEVTNNSAVPKTTKAKKSAGKKTKTENKAVNLQPIVASTSQEKPLTKSLPFESFDKWCAEELKQWKNNIDIPTFISFLKDIESFEDVKDYIKSVTGETPEANHFIDNYLHKRSRLLGKSNEGEGTSSGHTLKYTSNDFQEVKGKNKKAKNKKMCKVDSRILGFSTTASVDRINIGELDSV